MEKVKTFDQFILESTNYDDSVMINEEFIADTIDKISDWFEARRDKQLTKGQHAIKAKSFNYSDFVKFVKNILPSYSNLKEKKQKKEFFEKIDRYLEPITGIVGMATMLAVFSDDFANLFANSIGKGGILTAWGITSLASLFSKITKNSMTDSTDVSIDIERDFSDQKVVIDFKFFYSIGVKNTYRILYNSVVRLLQKYEKEEWSGIEYGTDSKFKLKDEENKVPTFGQHKLKMDFYPEELVDLFFETALEIYDDRKEYAEENDIKYTTEFEDDLHTRKVKFSNQETTRGIGVVEFRERKDMPGVEFYIQCMSNKQLIDLSKKIDNLKLEYHKPKKQETWHYHRPINPEEINNENEA